MVTQRELDRIEAMADALKLSCQQLRKKASSSKTRKADKIATEVCAKRLQNIIRNSKKSSQQ